MSKFRYPKCPYCNYEYRDKGIVDTDYTLMKLATEGWMKEAKHKCSNCGKDYMISVKIMYYARKINES